jgi:hypothetical protein
VIGGTKGAAARLGLNSTTLINKMKKLGISRPSQESTKDQPFESPARGPTHSVQMGDHSRREHHARSACGCDHDFTRADRHMPT